MAVPHLKAGGSGVESGEMHGIAVTEAGVVESASVVVNGHGTIGNLVASVAIYISNA